MNRPHAEKPPKRHTNMGVLCRCRKGQVFKNQILLWVCFVVADKFYLKKTRDEKNSQVFPEVGCALPTTKTRSRVCFADVPTTKDTHDAFASTFESFADDKKLMPPSR